MISKMLMTAAVALALGGSAFAQVQPPDPLLPQPTPMEKKAEGHLASNLIGESVYNGAGSEGDYIGDVNDLVISPDGTVEAIVIGVGGFLGIGEKDVAIEYDLAELMEVEGEVVLVVETTTEALKAQEDFERSAFVAMPIDADVRETKPATAEDLAKAPVEEAPAAIEEPAGDLPAEMPQEPAPQ